MKYQSKKRALVLLADGTIFYGKAVGDKEGTAVGEVCFNTGMTRIPRNLYGSILFWTNHGYHKCPYWQLWNQCRRN